MKVLPIFLATFVTASLSFAGIYEYGKNKATEGFKDKLKESIKKEIIEHRKNKRAMEGENKSNLTKIENKALQIKKQSITKGKELVGQEKIDKYNKLVEFKENKKTQIKSNINREAKELLGEEKIDKMVKLKNAKEKKESELAEKTIKKGKEILLGSRIGE